VIKALENRGDKKTVESLKKLLTDKDENVRKAAQSAIDKIGQ
jgi:HEAT repeat protein